MPALILKVIGELSSMYVNHKIIYSLIQLLYQLKDHVLQTMGDVIKSVLMRLELYSVIVKLDTSVLPFYQQNALVSLKMSKIVKISPLSYN